MAVAMVVKPPRAPGSGACGQCGSELKPGKKFCSRCGAPITAATPVESKKSEAAAGPLGSACPRCGADNVGGVRFCLICGEPLLGRRPALRQFLFRGSSGAAGSASKGSAERGGRWPRVAMAAMVALLAIGAVAGRVVVRKRARRSTVVLASQRLRGTASGPMVPIAAGGANDPKPIASTMAQRATAPAAAAAAASANNGPGSRTSAKPDGSKSTPDTANQSAPSSDPTPDPFSSPPSSPAVVAAVQSVNQTPPPPSATTASPALQTPKLRLEALPEIALSRTRPGEGILHSVPAPAPEPDKHPSGGVGPTRIRVGGQLESAKLVYGPKPGYPPLAKTADVRGTVRLEALIGEDGRVRGVKVLAGNDLLTPAALEAVKQWRYRPTLLNGKPVQVETEVDIIFTF